MKDIVLLGSRREQQQWKKIINNYSYIKAIVVLCIYASEITTDLIENTSVIKCVLKHLNLKRLFYQ